MTTETRPVGRVNIFPSLAELKEKLAPLREELATFHRELPRLLAEGEAGRYALIKGGQLLSIWDTHRDAVQYGCERFGPDEPFMAQRIDPRLVEVLARLVPEDNTPCPA